MRIASALGLALFMASASTGWAQNHTGHSAQPAAAPNEAASRAYLDANAKMMADMHGMNPTGDPDRDFVMMMIPHHQGAIDMARVQLQHGKDVELRALAEKIIADQEREIAEMQDWLSKR